MKGSTLQKKEVLPLPLYDKSRYGGKGDRVEEERWPTVTGPIDVAMVEG